VKLRALHQFHPTIAYGDAVGNDCFELQGLLERNGVRSDLFAHEAMPDVRPFVRDRSELAAIAPRDAALLVHVSMGNESLDEVARLPLPKAVVYHNITPAEHFAGVSEHNRHYAELGRRQLRDLAGVSELGIGDSEYNRRELEALGYTRTAVVPILLDWDAYDQTPDPDVLRTLAAAPTAIVAMGQLMPHKAIHDVIAGFAAYRRSDPGARLFVVGSSAMAGDYVRRLHDDVRRLGLDDAVVFAGKVPFDQWLAYYRGATALLTLSDHEGFWVPGLEAMHFDVPIVAYAAGAIPDTVGDAGLLLGDKSPDAVAAALERVVRDRALRADLVATGRRRLEAFSREAVERALRAALAQAGWEFGTFRPRTLALLSSDQRCGVHDYSVALADGLRAIGHQVTFVGLPHLDTERLRRGVAGIPRGTDAVIVEHEAGIFRDVPFVRALLSLRRKRIPVILSLHEMEPEKFHHYRMLSHALHYRPRYSGPLELLRAPWVALRIASWFVQYRAVLALMGGLPRKILTHSDRSHHWVGLLTSDQEKLEQQPLLLMPLEDTDLPRDAAEKRALRERLGLPTDRFLFISPGFFFARKRFIEVIRALPAAATLVLSGTKSLLEPGYFDEVMQFIADRKIPNVVVRTEFEGMGAYVAASDCVVLFYEDVFQSAVATQAVWAGIPAIYSGAPGFRLYRAAGLVATDAASLAEAMRDIQQPETHARLRGEVAALRRLLAPERLAARYLVGLD
jgi:glycosyltransferase involved in cell wall biosynthesis